MKNVEPRTTFLRNRGYCFANTVWSWSAKNEEEKSVVITLWNDYGDVVLNDDWKFSADGRRANGYPEAVENMKLVIEEGWTLYVMKIWAVDTKSETRKVKWYDPYLAKAEVRYNNEEYTIKRCD